MMRKQMGTLALALLWATIAVTAACNTESTDAVEQTHAAVTEGDEDLAATEIDPHNVDEGTIPTEPEPAPSVAPAEWPDWYKARRAAYAAELATKLPEWEAAGHSAAKIGELRGALKDKMLRPTLPEILAGETP